ncbi:MAG: ABC transporter ATP-binding protein [Halobacteriales archaeon]|nr:ABC transporter ATP-binding protein [Halobacteriales archaeon]
MTDDALLEVTGIAKAFGNHTAVADVSFSVPRGAVVCLVGPNGAGKTTTLQMAQGLLKPDRGTIRLLGMEPRKAARTQGARLGVLPQRFHCFPLLTVRENLGYFAALQGARPDLEALLAALGLTADADRRYGLLSDGTRRRVGIASTLVNDPELVFLDEPTAGVDPASRRLLWDIVLRLRSEGRSVVLTTHYMDEAERLSDHVIFIDHGRVTAAGTPDALRRRHGGGSVLALKGLAGALPAAVAARAVTDPAGLVRIPLSAPEEAPGLLVAMAAAGATFQEVSIREPSLDDAFLQLARGGAA